MALRDVYHSRGKFVRLPGVDAPLPAEPTDILPLSTDSPALGLVGGKARSLARLVQAGFAVPNGFVIPTGVYRSFVEAHGLDGLIMESAVPVVTDGRLSFANASDVIRRLFTSHPVPGGSRP